MADVRLSKKFTLQLSDFWRGLIMAVGTPVLVFIQDWLDKSNEGFNWRLVAKIALAALVTYLIKNFAIEPPKTIVTTDTNVKAETATEAVKQAVQ